MQVDIKALTKKERSESDEGEIKFEPKEKSPVTSSDGEEKYASDKVLSHRSKSRSPSSRNYRRVGIDERGSNYRLDPEEIFKTKLCEFYPKCPDGSKCRFAHGVNELRVNKSRFKTAMCYRIPNCKAGKFCNFAHSSSELRRSGYEERRSPRARRRSRAARSRSSVFSSISKSPKRKRKRSVSSKLVSPARRPKVKPREMKKRRSFSKSSSRESSESSYYSTSSERTPKKEKEHRKTITRRGEQEKQIKRSTREIERTSKRRGDREKYTKAEEKKHDESKLYSPVAAGLSHHRVEKESTAQSNSLKVEKRSRTTQVFTQSNQRNGDEKWKDEKGSLEDESNLSISKTVSPSLLKDEENQMNITLSSQRSNQRRFQSDNQQNQQPSHQQNPHQTYQRSTQDGPTSLSAKEMLEKVRVEKSQLDETIGEQNTLAEMRRKSLLKFSLGKRKKTLPNDNPDDEHHQQTTDRIQFFDSQSAPQHQNGPSQPAPLKSFEDSQRQNLQAAVTVQSLQRGKEETKTLLELQAKIALLEKEVEGHKAALEEKSKALQERENELFTLKRQWGNVKTDAALHLSRIKAIYEQYCADFGDQIGFIERILGK